MNFHILGFGAVGHLVAHHLRRVLPLSHTITIIHKTPSRARDFLIHGGSVSVERDGVITAEKGFVPEPLYIPHEQQTYPGTRVPSAPSRNVVFPDLSRITSLIITTKAHQVTVGIKQLLPRLSSDSTVVLLHNGMGVYEELINDVFRNEQRRPHFILASNTHGVFIKNAYTAVHTGLGEMQFGIVPDPAGRDFEASYHDEHIAQHERSLALTDIADPANKRYHSLHATVSALVAMEELSVSWKPISEMQLAMRRKLVVNSVINPLTAIMGCRNGDILKTKAIVHLMGKICGEASKLFAAQYLDETQHWLDDLSKRGMDPQEVSVGRLHVGLSEESLRMEVIRVARATDGNISSMLSDVRRGRKTEVQYITGYLLRLAKIYKVNVPYIAMLHYLIKMRSEIPLDQML
ncbi:hypothetical protein APHAL10511_007877 [Amanita phalloides]|nr:hypothetical protein APHAL10511_007877 [Amanita phalloides]